MTQRHFLHNEGGFYPSLDRREISMESLGVFDFVEVTTLTYIRTSQ